MVWHVPDEYLTAYVSGGLDEPESWSVETHVAECETCAPRISAAIQGTELAGRVASVRERVITQAGVEASVRAQVGTRVASSWTRVWRLLTAAPALRISWMAAAMFAVVCATVLSLVSGDGPGGAQPVLLLIAPLLPLAGVVVSYGPGMDPIHELTLTTPYSGLRLLLWRTITVLGVTIPLLLAADFVLNTGLATAAWLLPTLALVLVTLTLGSWIDHRLAAGIIVVGWAIAVLAPRYLLVIDVSHVFTPAAQLMWAMVTVLTAGVLTARRGAYDRMEG